MSETEGERLSLAPNEMSLADARDAYQFASGKAGDIARQTAFAGIAIVWILSGQTLSAGHLKVPHDLLICGLFLVAGLALDLLQYCYQALTWGIYSRHMEKRSLPKASAPRWINWPAIGLLTVKLLTIVVAYVLLGAAVINRLN